MDEYEVKILDIDAAATVQKLELIGAKCVLSETTQIRWYEFNGADVSTLKQAKRTKKIIDKVHDFLVSVDSKSLCKNDAYLRLRKQGSYEFGFKYKEKYNGNDMQPFKEFEENIDETTSMIIHEELVSLGFYIKANHEKRRISYIYKDIRFDIDTWPGMPSYIEIEAAPSLINTGIEILGFKKENVCYESGPTLFKKYGITFWSDISFASASSQ